MFPFVYFSMFGESPPGKTELQGKAFLKKKSVNPHDSSNYASYYLGMLVNYLDLEQPSYYSRAIQGTRSLPIPNKRGYPS